MPRNKDEIVVQMTRHQVAHLMQLIRRRNTVVAENYLRNLCVRPEKVPAHTNPMP